MTQSTTAYDSCGNPTDIYANGVTRHLAYQDCLFARTETVSPDGSKQLTWTITWDEGKGVPLQLSDPNGVTTLVAYDEIERPTSVQGRPVRCPHIYYEYQWTLDPPTTTTSVFDQSWSALCGANHPGPGWRTTTTVANGGGQTLYSTMPVGDGRTIVSGWKVYDERGHVQMSAEPFYAGQLPPSAPPMGTREQTFDYDASSRLVHQTLPNGAVKTTVFGVDPTLNAIFQIVQSPAEVGDGVRLADVRSDLDGLGRVVMTQRSLTSGPESVVAKYDAADRILEMSLQGGAAVHSFAYDSLRRLISAFDPDTE